MAVFIKTNKPDVAEQLKSLGFGCVTEKLNKEIFYCFEQTPELAKVILDKFADARFIADDHLCF